MSSNKRIEQAMKSLSRCIVEMRAENDALRTFLQRISSYNSVEKLRRSSEKDFGLEFEEALEMAYENVISEARAALAWKPTPSAAIAIADHEQTTGVPGRVPVEPIS